MAKLYEIVADYAALEALAESGEDVSAALAELTDSLQMKAERIGALLRNFDAEAETCAAEEKRLAARRKARENAAERLREYVRRSMEEAGITRVKCATWTMSLQAHDSVVVDDLAKIPEQFKRRKVEETADKKAILAAHKQHGEVVEGARVVTNMTLVVR